MTTSRVSLTLRLAAAVLLFARLGGVSWMPPAPLSAGALVALVAHDRWRSRGGTWATLRARVGWYPVALGAILLLALAARVTGLGADLGHQPPDIDGHRLAASIRNYFVTGDIEYRTVEHYPGIVFWAMSASALVTFVWGLMSGSVRAIEFTTVEHFILAGRAVNVVFAAGLVACTAGIARRLSGRTAALAAALVVALAPLSIETTTEMRNDAGQVFLLAAAVLATLAAAPRVGQGVDGPAGSHVGQGFSPASVPAALWIAGACAGLAAGVKYTSVFVLVPVLLAALEGPPTLRVRRASAALAAFVLAVAISNHFLWYDFPNFLRQLSDQVNITGAHHWAATDNPSAMHRTVLATVGSGWPLLALAAVWGAWTLATGRRAAWLFWSFPLLYSWFTTHRPSQFPRWVFPLLPFVAVAGACALAELVRRLRRTADGADGPRVDPRRSALSIALAIVVLAAPVWGGLAAWSRRAEPNTAALVERWLAGKAPRGHVVLLEQRWLDLDGARFRALRVPDLAWALGAGRRALESADWVVVPETHFAHRGLEGLSLLHAVESSPRAWFGHLGYDYRVYAVPTAMPVESVDLRLAEPAAASSLGWDWERDGHGPGLVVPDRSAVVYLPPLAASEGTLEVDLASAGAAGGDAPLTVTVDQRAVRVTEIASPDAGQRRFAARVALPRMGRPVAVRLDPVKRGARLRAVAVRLGPTT
jgi:4-amino-4-deoxy-L-arabinose transferase-like glycosyltransferase